MPSAKLVVRSPIVVTPRVLQLRGIFDVPPATESRVEWNVDLPLDGREWSIGLIVGPSGAGKSTVARELFGDAMIREFDWPKDQAIVDAFPNAVSIKEITGLLSSVGFSSPPAWLRPFHALSNGEQFRVTMARALAEGRSLTVADEFTSVVDRTVAQIGSAAIGKTVRRRKQRFIAVTCHYDVLEWLQPDWVFEPHVGKFTWRELQRRPEIKLEIHRVHREAWQMFHRHHYLSAELHRAARCFVATWSGQSVAFTAVLPLPHPKLSNAWREHRTVCLPDFQGVGIGNAVSDAVGSIVRGIRGHYYSRTTAPGMIASRRRSRNWVTTSIATPPSHGRTSTRQSWRPDILRRSVGFRYIGPACQAAEALALWGESP